MNVNVEIALVPHKTIKSLVISYFREDWPKLSDEQILEKKTDFTVVLNHPIKNAKVKDLIKTIKKQGYWGYCQHFKKTKKYKEIHYWVSKKTTNQEIIKLFAHEITHARGIDSERHACDVGEICEFAYQILLSDFNNGNKEHRK